MAGPISAKGGYLKVGPAGGAVATVADARNIRYEKSSENQVYGSSSTGGFRRRLAGYRDYVLSFDVYAQNGALIWTYEDGTSIKAEGYSATGVGFKGTFFIERISGIVDIEGGTLVGISVECGGDGTPGIESL
jgi:hypothetical protein